MTETQIKKLLKDKNVKYCYILKHGNYYRPNACGYTEYRFRAGVYKKDDAINHARGCNQLTLIPVNISEHNQIILREIKGLLENFIDTKAGEE